LPSRTALIFYAFGGQEMRKAKVFLEIEIVLNKDDPNDKSLSYAEIADIACGGVAIMVRDSVEKNKRPSKLIDARYEFTISKKCN